MKYKGSYPTCKIHRMLRPEWEKAESKFTSFLELWINYSNNWKAMKVNKTFNSNVSREQS